MKRCLPWHIIVVASVASCLAACNKQAADAGPSQLVAKVNKGEITAHQLTAALTQLPSGASDTASASAVLERLIDQELLVQKARDANLDRDPAVVAAMEAAKRAVLATAYLQSVSANVAQPTAQDINDYFVQHPEYFVGRREYVYRLVTVHAPPPEVRAIEQQLGASKNVDAILGYLKVNKIDFIVNAVSKTTEQLPVESRSRIAALNEGDTASFPAADGIDIVQLVSSRPEPVDAVQGRPFIEKYLLDQRRTERAASELKALRAAANIQYVGDIKAPVAMPNATAAADDVRSGIVGGIH